MKTVSIGGRKYDIVRLVLWQGFTLAIVGIVGAMLKPEPAQHIAAMVGSYAIVASVGVAAFNGANAYITGRHGPTKTTIESSTQKIETGAEGTTTTTTTSPPTSSVTATSGRKRREAS